MANLVFQALCKARQLPPPTAEHRFNGKRRWRFDYAWPEQKIALEVEGGVWTRGRHTRPQGFLNDMEKYNNAAMHGWRVIRCTPDTLLTNTTIDLIRECLRKSTLNAQDAEPVTQPKTTTA